MAFDEGLEGGESVAKFDRQWQVCGQVETAGDRNARRQLSTFHLHAVGRDVKGVSRSEAKAGVEPVGECLSVCCFDEMVTRPVARQKCDVP
jgi:hypothetical protein